MPLSNKRKAEIERAKSSILRYGVRHECTKCGTVHRFFDDHCHNPKCGFKGDLKRVGT